MGDRSDGGMKGRWVDGVDGGQMEADRWMDGGRWMDRNRQTDGNRWMGQRRWMDGMGRISGAR